MNACVPASPGPDGRPEPLPGADDACGASRVRTAVGQQRSDALAAEVARRSGAERIRWIGPGDAVTQDFRPDRLNVHLDERGRIRRVVCG